MIWKKFPLLKFIIIGVFVNTGTADYKYPVSDCENLKFFIQMELSLKQKAFSKFFFPFMSGPTNFKHSQTKEDRHS